MSETTGTKLFKNFKGKPPVTKEVLSNVYKALQEQGYNPVSQIVGYIMSGDPSFITSYKGARSMIMKLERDELVEELLSCYIKNNILLDNSSANDDSEQA